MRYSCSLQVLAGSSNRKKVGYLIFIRPYTASSMHASVEGRAARFAVYTTHETIMYLKIRKLVNYT